MEKPSGAASKAAEGTRTNKPRKIKRDNARSGRSVLCRGDGYWRDGAAYFARTRLFDVSHGKTSKKYSRLSSALATIAIVITIAAVFIFLAIRR